MHTVKPPFSHSLGPKTAKIAFVGEAFGEQEEMVGLPFQGSSGQELTRMLKEAGIERKDCFFTNVFPIRPAKNDIKTLCVKKALTSKDYPYPPLSMGNYVEEQYCGELARLKEEISIVRPNLIVALGNTACWAVLRATRINSIRGAVAESTLCPGTKVLPTIHPAAVMRNWGDRPIVVADFLKAKREAEFPEIVRPSREILVSPTMAEIWEWTTRPAEFYATDIETTRGQIDMIGFARSKSDALVIPFVDNSKPGRNYWSTVEEELEARKAVQFLLGSSVHKIFQNGLYDMQYLLRDGYKLKNVTEDTMLMHHSAFPEMKKGLGFLGSIYTSEASWKLLRVSGMEEFKRDE